MSEHVRITRDGAVLRVVLDKPDALNAVDVPMLAAMADAVESPGPDARVVLVTGSGRGFCSGADLSAVEDDADGGTLEHGNRLVRAMTESPLPVVAGVNGVAAGIGCSIALAADVTLARSSASFLLAFVNIGLMPDGGATELVAASIGRARAHRMALLGEKLPADVAAEIGLVHKSLDDDAYDAELAMLLERFSTGPGLAYARTKAAINATTVRTLAATLEHERAEQDVLLASRDFAEGVDAFRNKRPAVFEGR